MSFFFKSSWAVDWLLWLLMIELDRVVEWGGEAVIRTEALPIRFVRNETDR
jgi:hypothetical protein